MRFKRAAAAGQAKSPWLAYTMGIAAISVGMYSVRAGVAAPAAQRCAALASPQPLPWPDVSMRLLSSALVEAGPYTPPPMPGGPVPVLLSLPEHCEVIGLMQEREGFGGQHYAIKFHLRLPTTWNQDFFFQGGGGSEGVLGDALGPTSSITPPALLQGYAVMSEDSGHDNALNTDPTHGGAVAFGFDAQARANYGGASLKVVADAGKAIIRFYYGKPQQHAYFVGCSKGGQEGMVFAQRFPEEFDGILASAPGFSLPRAALAEAWDVQSITAIDGRASGDQGLLQFVNAFADADLKLAADAALSVCDAKDGVKDGMISNYPACTKAVVMPAVRRLTCKAGKLPTCLSAAQIRALVRIMDGPRDSKGHSLYSPWQWDAGIAAPGWRIWKLGSADHHIPALNVALGGASLAAVFTTPPTVVDSAFQATWAYQMGFDFNRHPIQIYASNEDFPRSAWQEIAARSSDLDAFKARDGKLIVPHGVSDPVFSVLDTLSWYRELDARTHGQANRFVRVFPVPGMNHCTGGPATDQFDAFSALRDWVEKNVAPAQIIASAGGSSPWPGRSRPLCPYPSTAHYRGVGSVESANSFECR